MKKYRILVLTDHSKHSKENSLYALVATLAKHDQCKEVLVASRGNTANDSFFKDRLIKKVLATKATADFAFQANGGHFMNETSEVLVSSFDVIFMRLPRPISDDFLRYLMEVAPKAVFVNNPQGIMDTSTKEFLLNFPTACPPMKMCHSAIDVLNFASKFPIVLKPLKEYGGKGVVKVMNQQVSDGNNNYPLKDYLVEIKAQLEQEGYLAMKYLKNVSQGDKRILVVNGQILAASLRLPAENSWLCNVAQGGTSVPATITPKEEAIIKEIAPILLERGIVFFGADTLVDDNNERIISEVNTLSIGGFPQSEIQTGKPVVQMAIDNMIDYINSQF